MEKAEPHLQVKETRKYFFGGMVAMAGKTKEEERLPRILMAREPLSSMRFSFGSFLPTIRARIGDHVWPTFGEHQNTRSFDNIRRTMPSCVHKPSLVSNE